MTGANRTPFHPLLEDLEAGDEIKWIDENMRFHWGHFISVRRF